MVADFRPWLFRTHDKPVIVTIIGEPLACVVACPECGASSPKPLPGPTVAVDAWNRRSGQG